MRRFRAEGMRMGLTLQELLLVIVVGTGMIVLVVTLIQKTLRFSNRSQSQIEWRQMVSRLNRQLREDVHQAQAAVVDDAASLTLTGRSVRVVYSFDVEKRQIARNAFVLVSEIDQPQSDSEKKSRQIYRLTDDVVPTFGYEAQAGLVTLCLYGHPHDKTLEGRFEGRIVAVLNRDERLVSACRVEQRKVKEGGL